jgi:hypothetical protein
MLFSLALQHKSLIVVWHLICTLSSYNHWSISELGREQKFLDDIECHSVTHLFSFILISLWKEEGFLIYNFPGSSVVMFHDILTGDRLAVPLWTWNDLASFSLNEVLSGGWPMLVLSFFAHSWIADSIAIHPRFVSIGERFHSGCTVSWKNNIHW